MNNTNFKKIHDRDKCYYIFSEAHWRIEQIENKRDNLLKCYGASQ